VSGWVEGRVGRKEGVKGHVPRSQRAPPKRLEGWNLPRTPNWGLCSPAPVVKRKVEKKEGRKEHQNEKIQKV
jgi:hypothetical protein